MREFAHIQRLVAETMFNELLYCYWQACRRGQRLTRPGVAMPSRFNRYTLADMATLIRTGGQDVHPVSQHPVNPQVDSPEQKSPKGDFQRIAICEDERTRDGTTFNLAADNPPRLSNIAAASPSLQKHIWFVHIILLSGDGMGTSAIMTLTGKLKTCV